ncbi:hypothetical protein GCM10009839_63530 [Catenulispora yoronensis]|uniref:Uncharacterized protein n=2 Tax=Catenulispora yoronensis TaxID=450799 RepID=A0ABP5GKC0_9ACTN
MRGWSAGTSMEVIVMRKARSILATLLLAAVTIHVLWIAVAPLVPYLVSSFVVVLVLGFIYHRMTRW